MSFDVRRYGLGYAVYDGDAPLTGEIRDRFIALQQADRLAEKAKAKTQTKRRPCLCCGGGLDSEGAHQRLCQTCSQFAGSFDLQMVG